MALEVELVGAGLQEVAHDEGELLGDEGGERGGGGDGLGGGVGHSQYY
jgi:hypothetical protein